VEEKETTVQPQLCHWLHHHRPVPSGGWWLRSQEGEAGGQHGPWQRPAEYFSVAGGLVPPQRGPGWGWEGHLARWWAHLLEDMCPTAPSTHSSDPWPPTRGKDAHGERKASSAHKSQHHHFLTSHPASHTCTSQPMPFLSHIPTAKCYRGWTTFVPHLPHADSPFHSSPPP
jgi:hypothetical protein